MAREVDACAGKTKKLNLAAVCSVCHDTPRRSPGWKNIYRQVVSEAHFVHNTGGK